MENQRRGMRKLYARQGWAIAAVYEDDGYSGLRMDRPGLQAMLRDAAKGKFSVLVVWDVSRLTRSCDGLPYILHLLSVHGVGFCVAIQAMEHPRAEEDDISSLLWKMYGHTVVRDWPWRNPLPEKLKVVSPKRMKKLRAHP